MKRADTERYASDIRAILDRAGIPLAEGQEIEVADFGLGDFQRTGLGLVTRINEPEYCSKWLVLLPGQTCPEHYHRAKKESFFVHSGIVGMRVDGREFTLAPGHSFTLEPGARHEFWSDQGAIVEEVSTHDENSDSYFADARIVRDPVIE